MSDRPTITLSDLPKLRDDLARQGQALNDDDVQDYATAALVLLRGVSRRDKLKVIARMRRIMGK